MACLALPTRGRGQTSKDDSPNWLSDAASRLVGAGRLRRVGSVDLGSLFVALLVDWLIG